VHAKSTSHARISLACFEKDWRKRIELVASTLSGLRFLGDVLRNCGASYAPLFAAYGICMPVYKATRSARVSTGHVAIFQCFSGKKHRQAISYNRSMPF
jgi:hypothetical protein